MLKFTVSKNLYSKSLHKMGHYFLNGPVQGPHGKLVQKENLSHTLKNKVFFLIFLVFHDIYIEEDKDK